VLGLGKADPISSVLANAKAPDPLMSDYLDYVRLAEEDLRAAELSISNEVRLAHAARAVRYAQLAAKAAGKGTDDIRATLSQSTA
jgi:hypothetical protein